MKNLRIVLILLMYLGQYFAIEAGCVCGKVVDAKTKEPLIGVNIRVLETTLGATTDIEGNYRISDLDVGTYRLEYRYIGYKNVIRTDVVVVSNKPQNINIEMEVEKISIEGVEVTTGYFETEQKFDVSNVSLSREEIRRFPGGFEDVARTVSTLPGVAINVSGGRNDILVRGGGPSENLFVINGLEVPNINHFGTQGSSSGSLSFINLDFVDNVSFSTGGFGVQFGDKLSSVLEIDLAKGRQDRIGGKGLVSATQFGFNLEGPISERGNFIFSARKSYLDLIFKAAGLPFVPVYTDFNFISNYDFKSGDQLFIVGLAAIDRVERFQETEEDRVVNAGIMDNTQNQFISGVTYRHLINKGYLDFSFNLNYNQFRFSQIDTTETEYFKSEADEAESILRLKAYRSFTDNLGFTAGLVTKYVNLNNQTEFADTIFDRNGQKVVPTDLGLPSLNQQDMNVSKHAFFVESDWVIFPKLEVIGGIRGDYYEYIDEKLWLSPRISANFIVNPSLSFKGSSGIYYQSPSYVWIVNPENKKLKALQNQMNIIGIDYLLRYDYRLTIEAYHKKYSQIPTGTLPGVTDYLVISNSGAGFGGREDNFQSFGYIDLVSEADGQAYGLELSIQKKYSDIPLYGQMTLSWGKSEYTAYNGQKYPNQFDQRFIFNLSGGYKFNEKWEVSGKFRYFTGVPYTPIQIPSEANNYQIQNIPQEYLSQRLDAGHHLDLRVDRYINLKNISIKLFIDIQNVYDYAVPIKPTYDFWNKEISESNSIGLLPSIGVSVDF